MRKLFTLILVFIALLVSNCASNQIIDLREDKQNTSFAFIKVPLAVDVEFINQREVNIFPAYQKLITYRIPTGKVTIGLKYNNLHVNSDGDEEKIRSNTVQVNFMAEQGETYRIKFATPQTFEQAIALSENFSVNVLHNGKPVANSEVNDVFDLADISTEKSTEKPDIDQPPSEAAASQHLQYWWSIASEAERKAFLQSLRKN